MSTAVQRRRGTTAQHASFAGLNGELTVDTDKEVVVVHDGTTAGGYPQMRENGSNSALALGSAGTPSLKFTGDTNTGIYSPGADQVAISTNGTGRLFVDANGLVSVGTSTAADAGITQQGKFVGFATRLQTSGQRGYVAQNGDYFFLTANRNPSGTFDDTNRSTADLGMECANGGSNIYFKTAAANNTIATERLRITSAGLVGIGTSSPSADLHISRSSGSAVSKISVSAGASTFARLQLSQSPNTSWQVYTGGDTNKLGIGRDGVAEYLTIDSSGRVGIGTTSPGYPLHVFSSTSTVGIRVDGGGDSIVSFANAGSAVGALGIAAGAITSGGSGNIGIQFNSSLLFASGGTSEKGRFDSSGRLLVGTSSASGNALLQVAGGIRQTLFADKPDTAGVPAVGETRIYQFNLAAANTWENVLTPAVDGGAFYVIHFRIGVSDRTNSFGFAQLYYSTGAVLTLISGSASNIRVNSDILQLNGTGFGSYGLTTFMHVTRIG